MPAVQLNSDVVLGVAIPSRNARGRIARLGPVVDSILGAHRYPPVIERLLTQGLPHASQLGSLLGDPQEPL
jgi:molecular chaperone Hsp33